MNVWMWAVQVAQRRSETAKKVGGFCKPPSALPWLDCFYCICNITINQISRDWRGCTPISGCCFEPSILHSPFGFLLPSHTGLKNEKYSPMSGRGGGGGDAGGEVSMSIEETNK